MNTAVKFPLPSRSLSPWGSHYQREFIHCISGSERQRARPRLQRPPSPRIPSAAPRRAPAAGGGLSAERDGGGHFPGTYRFPQEPNLHGFKFTCVNLNGFAGSARKEAGPGGYRRGVRCSVSLSSVTPSPVGLGTRQSHGEPGEASRTPVG